MEKDQCEKIKGDLLSEKANLEYELNLIGTDKRDLLIKLERLESYVKRADRIIEKHGKNLERIFEKTFGDRDLAKKGLKKYIIKPTVNVMVGN